MKEKLFISMVTKKIIFITLFIIIRIKKMKIVLNKLLHIPIKKMILNLK